MLRHHVFRQRGFQGFQHRFFIQHRTGLGHQITHQTHITRTIFTHQHHGLGNALPGCERSFDFTQFDTVTAHLYLEVQAPQVFKGPLRTPASTVTGAVELRTRFVTEGITDEAVSRQVVAAQIAQGHAIAAYAQLAGYAELTRLALRIQHPDRCIGDWRADGNSPGGIFDTRTG